jgi:hypothetical protein
VIDQADRLLDQSLSQFSRIPDRCRGKDESRPGSIELRDPFQPANDIGDMRAKDTPIGVSLVDDDVAQAGEEFTPVGVVGKDAGMQHVRVG